MKQFYHNVNRDTLTAFDRLVMQTTITQYRLMYVFAVSQLLTEVVMYFVYNGMGEIHIPQSEYLTYYLWIPTGINFMIILASYVLLRYAKSVTTGVYVVSIGLLFLCTDLYFMHHIFDILVMLFLVPLLLSCVYGNKVITIGLGLAGILIKGILDSAMYFKVWAHYVVEEPYDKTLVIMNFVLYTVIMLVVIYFCISVINVEKKKRVLAIELEQEMQEKVKKEMEMLEEVSKDPLTGILNRKAGEKKICHAIIQNSKGTLFLMDMDGFKAVNDCLGHPMGDKVLIEIAQLLQNSFRSSDVVCRLGGDEFMVYASEMEQAKTEEKAKELLEKCKRTLLTPDQKEIQIGISIGIAQFPTDGEHYNILYANADAALYKAKKSGKGDYVFF